YDSAAALQHGLRGDLFLISAKTESIIATRTFARRRLHQARAFDGVGSVASLSLAVANWKNPWDGAVRAIFVIGADAETSPLNLPGLDGNWEKLRRQDAAIFDRGSRPEFGPVAATFDHAGALSVEINNHRMDVAGLFTLGASFAANGNLIVSSVNFGRLFAGRPAGVIDLGAITLAQDADRDRAQHALQVEYGGELRVLTRDELIGVEIAYWREDSAIGFIFHLGVVIGFLVGLVVVYQILFTDVVKHLPEYATLKAMGYTD